jgi:hypothetical protein
MIISLPSQVPTRTPRRIRPSRNRPLRAGSSQCITHQIRKYLPSSRTDMSGMSSSLQSLLPFLLKTIRLMATIHVLKHMLCAIMGRPLTDTQVLHILIGQVIHLAALIYTGTWSCHSTRHRRISSQTCSLSKYTHLDLRR